MLEIICKLRDVSQSEYINAISGSTLSVTCGTDLLKQTNHQIPMIYYWMVDILIFNKFRNDSVFLGEFRY